MEEEGLLRGNPKVKPVCVRGRGGEGGRWPLWPKQWPLFPRAFIWKIAEELKLGEAGCWLRVLDISLEWFSRKDLDMYL